MCVLPFSVVVLLSFIYQSRPWHQAFQLEPSNPVVLHAVCHGTELAFPLRAGLLSFASVRWQFLVPKAGFAEALLEVFRLERPKGVVWVASP